MRYVIGIGHNAIVPQLWKEAMDIEVDKPDESTVVITMTAYSEDARKGCYRAEVKDVGDI